MDKIIALYARGGVGKTATLNLVIDLLEVATTGCKMPAAQPDKKDRKKTFEYKGKRISISTSGDTGKHLLENEIYFMDNKCDIGISAARSRGETHKILNKLAAKHGIKVEFIRKTGPAVSNLKQANDIIGKL